MKNESNGGNTGLPNIYGKEGINKLFSILESDKSLPTFADHFVQCILLGTARNVDLKKMYPGPYAKLEGWIAGHHKHIFAQKGKK